MKVFVAGATGALGSSWCRSWWRAATRCRDDPRRGESGTCVRGAGRTAGGRRRARPRGGRRAPSPRPSPEVIVHQLTALSGPLDLRHFDRVFALTNRLRTEGTDHLLAAGRAVGSRAASSPRASPAGRSPGSGGPVKTEDDPLDPDPPNAFAADARRDPPPRGGRRPAPSWTEGIVLRYGGFYGPGTCSRSTRPATRSRRSASASFPIVGRRRRRLVVHPHRGRRGGDGRRGRARRAAASTTSSTTSRRRSREWLPALASALGAKPPRRVPRWLGRLAAGEAATVDDDRGARGVEREGEARARLAAALPELARRASPTGLG